VATGCKPLLDSDWAAITRLKTPTESLDASGLLVLLSFVAFASLLAPLGLFTASDAECPAQGSLFFNFPKPEMVSDYYRDLTRQGGSTSVAVFGRRVCRNTRATGGHIVF